jgi:hypothetical protein
LIKDYKNTKVTEYKDFLDILEEVGFMPLSNNCLDYINLSGLTEEKEWHTGLDTDPWAWRVRTESEHKAAYAKLFDKKPGFIACDWYPLFLATRRKGRSFKDMYSDGYISNYAKQIYELFNENNVLAVHEIKSLCGFTKETNSKYEAAMIELQMGMFITINGTKQKINSRGEAFGWPSTAYSTVETWAGKELIEEANEIDYEEAVDNILYRIKEVKPDADGKKIKKFIALE